MLEDAPGRDPGVDRSSARLERADTPLDEPHGPFDATFRLTAPLSQLHAEVQESFGVRDRASARHVPQTPGGVGDHRAEIGQVPGSALTHLPDRVDDRGALGHLTLEHRAGVRGHHRVSTAVTSTTSATSVKA